jgi:holo-[acyl-carrier protein] synthase
VAIVGIGIDIVNVDRFVASLQRTPGLRDRLFVANERDLPDVSLAARFAAKEAVAKALGAPGDLRWHDVEVVRDVSGQPTLLVSGTVEAAAARLGASRWHVSLSHDAGQAIAMVVAES